MSFTWYHKSIEMNKKMIYLKYIFGSVTEQGALQMGYVIGVLIVFICIYFTGYFFKKKYFKEVDRLETWKLEIMDRPVLDELSKVKALNMTGQTEKLFEKWRSAWDEIVTSQLPEVETTLFDAEEYIDKYRFNKAKESLNKIEAELNLVEEQIDQILIELKELVGSEEKNRLEMEALKDTYRNYKKRLLTQRHAFGKPGEQLENRLGEMHNEFELFTQKTNEGNYLEAREIVLALNQKMEEMNDHVDQVPVLLVEVNTKLPNQLAELKDGFEEMKEQGYLLEHLQVEKNISEIEEEVKKIIGLVEEVNVKAASELQDEIKERIDSLYEQLEKEVMAKHFVSKEESKAKDLLIDSSERHMDLIEEMRMISDTYHVPDTESDTQERLQKLLTNAIKRYEVLEDKIKEQKVPHTILKEELTAVKEELDIIKEEQTRFSEKLEALRKDEMVAREKINDLKKQVSDLARLVSKSNIPGLPEEYKFVMKEANDQIKEVILRLEEKPLNISSVNDYMEIAFISVEKAVEYTEDMIETYSLTEKVIQYGNRYRSRHLGLKEKFTNAELAFRNYEYKAALELAATAIEEVEPGALEKIKDWINEEEKN